jgi:hypothetical protein
MFTGVLHIIHTIHAEGEECGSMFRLCEGLQCDVNPQIHEYQEHPTYSFANMRTNNYYF